MKHEHIWTGKNKFGWFWKTGLNINKFVLFNEQKKKINFNLKTFLENFCYSTKKVNFILVKKGRFWQI